jgi:hypothetical protein
MHGDRGGADVRITGSANGHVGVSAFAFRERERRGTHNLRRLDQNTNNTSTKLNKSKGKLANNPLALRTSLIASTSAARSFTQAVSKACCTLFKQASQASQPISGIVCALTCALH